MKVVNIIIFSCLLICLNACKQDSNNILSKTNSSNKLIIQEKSPLHTIKNMQKIGPGLTKSMNDAAETILQHRWKEGNKQPTMILDNQMWEYEFIFSGKEMSKPNEFAGHWIDFNEDMTYVYGLNQKESGTGRYSFDSNTDLLLLIDDNKALKPQEFKAKVLDGTMVLGGNNIYKDNNYQARLKRIASRPKG